jgi:hypothetical protein
MSAVLGTDGTLTVTGTSGADNINVSFQLTFSPAGYSGVLVVKDADTFTDFAPTGVKKVVINGGDGDDAISIDGSETDEDPKASAINFIVVDGNGQDSVSSYVDDTNFVQQYNVPAPTASLTVGDGNDQISILGGTNDTVVAGNGNDFISSSSVNDAQTVAVTAGNGTDIIQGAFANTAPLTINATVGTGFDQFQNQNKPDIFVNAKTTRGQTIDDLTGNVVLAGDLFVGAPTNGGVPGVQVLVDTQINGVTTTDADSAISDANGNYTISIPDSEPTLQAYFNIHLGTTAFTSSIPSRQMMVSPGVGYSGEDFLLAPVGTAAKPILAGTLGSYKNLGNSTANAVDGNLSTFFDAPYASGSYVGLDYGSPQVVTKISYAPRPGYASRMLQGLFQGSNSADFSNAVTLYTITATPAVGVLTTVTIPGNKGAFRYVRYIGAANDYCNIAEIRPVLAAKLAGIPIGTAGSYQGQGNTISKVFDGNFSTFFDAPVASGAWVGEDLGTAKVVYEVQFAPRSAYDLRMVGGQIQASNTADFSSGVVTLATIAKQPLANTRTTLALNNTTAYRYYRYIGPANSYCNISELEFDG